MKKKMGNSFNFFVEKVGLRGAKVTAEKLSESGLAGFKDGQDVLHKRITELIIDKKFKELKLLSASGWEDFRIDGIRDG